MKKDLSRRIKAALAVVLLLIVWAAWSYNGYIPGMTVEQPLIEDGQDLTATNKDVIRMLYDHYLFRTAAGGVAYVRLERVSGEEAEKVVESYTFPSRMCTHLRMLSFIPKMEYRDMAAVLGAPHSATHGSGLEGGLIYKTVDGYQYLIPMSGGRCGKTMTVIAPDGRRYSAEDTAALQQQVRAFYIGVLAGALPAVLVAFICLQTIPRVMEKRKGKTAEQKE